MTATIAPPRVGTTVRQARPARRPAAWITAAAVVLLVSALAVTAATLRLDSGEDLAALGASVGRALARLRWQWAALVVAFGAAHYLATAVAARAAAGVRTPIGETVLTQLAAAAANRLTPGGLGGAALNARYFSRRGLDRAAAVGAVAALAVLGAVADLLVLCVIVFVGRLLGLGGGLHELSALVAHIRRLLGPVRSPWLWAVVAGVVGALLVSRIRRSGAGRGTAAAAGAGVWRPVRRLLMNPRALATLLLASGTTTLILGFAFVASIRMVPGTHPAAAVGTILVAFMLAAAAGSSVPVPAGLGSTEGALVAVLVGLGESAGAAVQVVMIFRLITFWAPAGVGVLAGRILFRRSAL